jgi:hypothetical protein
MFNSRTFKALLAVMTVMILAGAAYAFAAANTVPTTKAGDGLGVISGYTVTNVVYTLNGTDPSLLDSVSFDLGAAASQVQIQLVAAGGDFYACTEVGVTTVWTCNTTSPSFAIVDADQLRVIAASN